VRGAGSGGVSSGYVTGLIVVTSVLSFFCWGVLRGAAVLPLVTFGEAATS